MEQMMLNGGWRLLLHDDECNEKEGGNLNIDKGYPESGDEFSRGKRSLDEGWWLDQT
jgi:hypothetical protein